ncbi:PEGA domain-containing protein [Megalodesulfovibrio gigas]|uniref:PEGA domain-containing protein n=1 Tax=Megalodesulfovibrio gigas (strain ATCC 19364 / DSM 1382 / NCIMB 9332 / VKM B-1759) TaxID=1121448 RepID=T2GE43_MEGG1|nr:PEGA domain-containing protein [Megalodesulfovibrio gigas]AGW14865.1 hypothetical protein DGI_3152 [Megalodesulfovibrio gigas DSM 1382 = ATCC 19364]
MRKIHRHASNSVSILLVWLIVCVALLPGASATQLAHPPGVGIWEMLFGPPPPGQRHATAHTSGTGTDAVAPAAALRTPGSAGDPAARPLEASTEAEVLKDLLCPYVDYTERAAVPAAHTTAPGSQFRLVTPNLAALLSAKIRPGAARTGRIFVSTTPQDATVRLLRHPVVFSQGMALAPGAYVVEAQRKGHAPVRREVTIRAGEDAACHLTLAPAPAQGQLFVNVSPANATVRVVNIKPVFSQGMLLEPGTYQLDAFQDGYRTAALNVTIAAGERKTIAMNLEPAGPQGRLFVQTEPAGAQVRILNIQPRFRQGMLLEEGTYTVCASLPGHDSVTVHAVVRPAEDNTLVLALPPAAPDGRLFVNGMPAGGTVRIMSVQPAFTQGMPVRPGVHVLELVFPGNKPMVHHVTVVPGEALHVDAVAMRAGNSQSGVFSVPMTRAGGDHATLTPVQAVTPAAGLASETSPAETGTVGGGRLFVQTAPSDADIRITHMSWSSPATYAEGMLLPEGTYNVSVFKEGYDPVLERVQVLPGKSTQLFLDLAARSQASAAATVPRRAATR